MTPKFTLFSFVIVAFLAACASPERIAVQTPEVTKSIKIRFKSVEVRDVSLPSYAAADEISVMTPDGTLSSSDKVLWADAPERAVALELSRNLTRLTHAQVASEPWPLEAYPDARLLVRFADMIAGADGNFRISGQYFVAVQEGGRERSGLFDMKVPFDPNGGPTAIARARGQIILELSEYLARKGLR